MGTNRNIGLRPDPCAMLGSGFARLPRLVVGGDFEGGLTPAVCPFGGAFALYEGFLLHMHTCVGLI